MNTTFEAPASPPPLAAALAKKKKSGCLMGCLITLGIVLVICMILAALIAPRMRGWTADVMAAAVTEMLKQSDLPESQKADLKALGDAFTADFRSGNIPFSAFGEIAEDAQRRGLADVLLLNIIDSRAQTSMGLSAAEKADAQRQVQRVTRGLLESKIDQKEAHAIAEPLSREGSHPMSDSQIRSYVTQLRKLADAAKIPDEPYEADIAAEFRDMLRRAVPDWKPPPPKQ